VILVDGDHPASLSEEALLARCELGKGRTSGPGGQHRNKVETEVTLTHETGITAKAGERRSVMENRRVALRRLRLALASEVRSPVGLGDARSDLWRSRTRQGRISCSTRHWDYPSLLAEAMDMLFACAWDPKKAAIRLDVTPSQLIKLVKEHRPAFALLNQAREAKGLHRLS